MTPIRWGPAGKRVEAKPEYDDAIPDFDAEDSAPDPTTLSPEAGSPAPLIRLSVHPQVRVGRVPVCCGSPRSKPGKAAMN